MVLFVMFGCKLNAKRPLSLYVASWVYHYIYPEHYTHSGRTPCVEGLFLGQVWSSWNLLKLAEKLTFISE